METIAATGAAGAVQAGAKQPFTLPPLPYAMDALEPYIDARTLEFHYGKHHAAYVNNLNAAIAGYPELAGKTIEELISRPAALPEAIRTAVRNNGGGHANHTFYWNSMKKGGGQPKGELARAVEQRFESFEKFQEQFTKAAMGVFGSGWAWLTLAGRELLIEQTANQETPLAADHVPLLVVDVWEHAYYLMYQNRRADYLAAFWNVIDWDTVAERYQARV